MYWLIPITKNFFSEQTLKLLDKTSKKYEIWLEVSNKSKIDNLNKSIDKIQAQLKKLQNVPTLDIKPDRETLPLKPAKSLNR